MRRLLALSVLWWAAQCACAGTGDDLHGELRLQWDPVRVNDAGPLAQANALAPGLAPVSAGSRSAEAELTGHWHAPGKRWSLGADLLLGAQRASGGATQSTTRFNELYASADLGAWQASAGKKIVGWDVGYGFRPNDVVQQELRRTLLSLTQEGRPLLQVEYFDADSATSLVWVNPGRMHDPDDAQRGARESALAARWYRRQGAVDAYLFGRQGEHTGSSLGAAAAWVATDELELHASVRGMQRHDGLLGPAGNAPAAANPWTQSTLGGASQWLLGASWTGERQQSVIVEAWHDGTAPSDAQWDAWRVRLQALAAMPGLPSLPRAANLAWQATPFQSTSLRRDNLFVRLAWQPEAWQLSLDTLLTPADRGRSVTASLQWQGDRVRLNAALRWYGGPASSVMARLPDRRVGVVAAAWTF